MGQKRQYTSYVLERTGTAGNHVFTVVETAESGTDARVKCAKVAADNPGKVFVACNIWPPVMAKEIKKVAFTNPDDPDGKLSDSPDIDVDDDDDVKITPVVSSASVTSIDPEPIVTAPVSKKVEVEASASKSKDEVVKPVVKSKASVKVESVKPEPAKTDAMDDLFAGTSLDDSTDNQENSFANEDVIDPDESDSEGDGGIPKGLF